MVKDGEESFEKSSVKNNQFLNAVEDYIVIRDQPTESSNLLNTNMKEKIIKYQQAFRNRSCIVDILSIFFGIGSWIGINSIFLQLPLLVETAPEKWTLPSYIVVIVQIGNIGPIAYTILQNFSPKKIRDAYMIYAVLVIGTASSLLTAFFYKHTAYIGEAEHSLSLFISVFFLALIGCTSSVLFMPYMGRFRETYLITYLIGEGLSGLLPSIVASIQGVGGNDQCVLVNVTENEQILQKYISPPLFGTKAFFIFVFLIFLCSCIAFFLLNNLKQCKKEYANVKITAGNNYEYGNTNNNNSMSPTDEGERKNKYLSNQEYKFLMLLIALVCMFGNGIFPSIESYSCIPYGNKIYHLTVIFTSIANPVACILAIFLPHTSIKSIVLLTALSILIGLYAVTTAVLSPNPPWVKSDIGGVIVVIVWTVLMGLVSYIKLCITTVMRTQGGKSLVWTGAISQAGSAVGSICIFVMINYTKIFVSYETSC